MVQTTVEEALILLRKRLCDPDFIFSVFSDSPESNYSKLKYLLSSSVTETGNNSILLLGPRGCGKIPVMDLVLQDLLKEYPDMISVIKLDGLLHCDDNCALKEIARQLCIEHELMFSKMASSDDNTEFMIAVLRECGLAHKTVVFVLDEFDLFAQGKQRLLYGLFDAMQSVSSQAVVIGVSCRLDADQLLEKRVRSRFSHRKLVFDFPKKDDFLRLLKHVVLLPIDSSLPHDYVTEFNSRFSKIVADKRFIEIIDNLTDRECSVSDFVRFLFSAVSCIDLKSGYLTLENFKSAVSTVLRQPKLDCIKDCSILELYILVCMKRLEVKEQETYNFNSVMKEYKSIHDSFNTSDNYSRSVCLRAFEHLLDRQLVGFTDRGHNQFIEFRTVKLLFSHAELHHGLKLNRSCPPLLQRLMES